MFSKIGTTLHLVDNRELRLIGEAEKTFISSFDAPSKAMKDAAQNLVNWAAKEEDGKALEDFARSVSSLTDITSKQYAAFCARHEEYRGNFKSIIRRQEALIPLEKRRDDTTKKLDDATKKQKPTDHLKRELEEVDKEVASFNVELDAFKRSTLQVAFNQRYDALIELGSKLSIIGTYGKFLVEQIPQGTLPVGEAAPPFDDTTLKHILSDVETALTTWRPSVGVGAAATSPQSPSDDQKSVSSASLTSASAVTAGVPEVVQSASVGSMSPIVGSVTPPVLSRSASSTSDDKLNSPVDEHGLPQVTLHSSASLLRTATAPGRPVSGTEIVSPYGKAADLAEADVKALKSTIADGNAVAAEAPAAQK